MNKHIFKTFLLGISFLSTHLSFAQNTFDSYNEATKVYQSKRMSPLSDLSTFNPSRLAPYKVLFIPGLATDTTEKVGLVTEFLHITPTPGFLSSFYQQRNWFKKLGIDFDVVNINRVGSCDENGEIIAKTIEASEKPVILISQSKGGVDLIHGLVNNPKVISKIAGWVAYQPPHAGSLLADFSQKNIALSGPSALLLKILKGSSLALTDMTTSFRSFYNFKHLSEIARLPYLFPIVTLVTTEVPATASQYVFGPKGKVAFLSPFITPITDHGGGDNDGIASVKGTCLRGSSCVYLPNIDHFDSVMNTAPFKSLSEAERVKMFKTLVEMLLERVESNH